MAKFADDTHEESVEEIEARIGGLICRECGQRADVDPSGHNDMMGHYPIVKIEGVFKQWQPDGYVEVTQKQGEW